MTYFSFNNSKLKLSPFWLMFYCFCIYLLWHISLVLISPFSLLSLGSLFPRMLWVYPLIIFIFSSISFFLFQKKYLKTTSVRLTSTLFLLTILIRALDWNVVYFYGSHIDYHFWENAFYADSLGMAATKVALISIFTSVLVCIIFFSLLKLCKQHFEHALKYNETILQYYFKNIFFSFLLIILFCGIIQLFVVNLFFTKPQSTKIFMRTIPEKHFISSIKYYIKSKKADPVVLTSDEILKLESLGIKLFSVNNEYPLLKRSIYLEKKVKKESDISITPNIIFIIVESLSSYFVEDENIIKSGAVNNIKDFIDSSLYFNNIYSAATPTMQGLVANLSSSLHIFRTTMGFERRNREINNQFDDKGDPLTVKYPFISQILKKQGYTSTHIQGGSASYTEKGLIFKLHKYNNFLSTSDNRVMNDRKYPLRAWGAEDYDTFTYVNRWLEKRINPFFLSVLTVDIHHPYNSNINTPLIKDKLLSCIYSTDQSFGLFWNKFKKSQLKNNTIVVLVADHSIFPSKYYLNLRGKSGLKYYDKIPIAIYSPYHKNLMGTIDSTLGTNLDLLPTIFELIGFDSINSFLGLSLLSDRKHYPFIFGRINLMNNLKSSKIDWNDKEHNRFINFLKFHSSRGKIFKFP